VDSPPPLRAPTLSWRRRHGWRFNCASPRCRCQLMPAHAIPAVADCQLPTSHRGVLAVSTRCRLSICRHVRPAGAHSGPAPSARPLPVPPLSPVGHSAG
jgi:hypothetical protein